MNNVAILHIIMIYRIAFAIGILSGFTLIGVGIGFSLPAVIIGGIFLVAVGAIGDMMTRMP
jgi:hypothetical protein